MSIPNFKAILFYGAISGLISYGSTMVEPGLFFGPGIIFGSIIGWRFHSLYKSSSWPKIFLFIIGSTLSYYAAVSTAVEVNGYFPGSITVPFLLAGLVGSFLLSLSVRFLLFHLSIKAIFTISIAGSVLALSMHILPEIATFAYRTGILSKDPADLTFLSLFFFWQIGMALVLGWGQNTSRRE